MDRWKAEQGRGREKRKIRRKKSRRERVRRKKMQMREQVGKSWITVFFQWCVAPEPAGQMRDEKLDAVVARSTFASQNVQNTPWSDHFWKLRCRKSARRCGVKHICKSKCTKHTSSGPLLEVQMSKKCTPLWCEAHFEVKMYKTHHGYGPLLEVQMSLRFASGQYTTLYTPLHYSTLHYTTLHNTTATTTELHNYTPLHSTTLNYTTLHHIKIQSTTLH